jgi:tRNA-splicing ligase RtcB
MERRWTGQIERVSEYRWRIPRSYKEGMRTDGIVYASGEMMREIRSDNSLEQVANVACLPSRQLDLCPIFTMGTALWRVAATDDGGGLPGGVGYDINCGVRLLRTNLTREVTPHQGLID